MNSIINKLRNLFKARPVLNEEDKSFQHECFKWLLRNIGGDEFYKNTHLVLPTKEYFPSVVASEEEAVVETFNKVKSYAGMESWNCKLEAQDEDPSVLVAPTVALQGVESSPLGTFNVGPGDEVTISYNPVLIGNPTSLVATFAHELAHYLTATIEEDPPGGWDNWEFATDICSVFLGFGIFAANSAVSFRQYTDIDSQGWHFSRSGYLTEAEYSYALGLFMELKECDIQLAYPYCDPNIKVFLKKSIREIRDSNIVSELLKIEYIDRNS